MASLQLAESKLDKLTKTSSLLFRKLEVDRAVIFLLLTRVWQMLAYVVTVVLIARQLTPELQGFYFTFASLLALQIFVELGFVLVILNSASHEWSHLSLDDSGYVVGDPKALSRLVGLGRLVFKWYVVASIIFVLGVGILGWAFFSNSPYSNLNWRGPWVTLIILSGFLLWTLPFNALLEGCNQVAAINRFRLKQTVLESAALWSILILGGGLWAAVGAVAVKLLRNLYLLLVEYRHFFEPFFKPLPGSKIDWRNEIWPMQWRLAVAGSLTYFFSSMFNPIMFKYRGAAVAGRMGMTLQMVNGIQIIAMAWVSTKIPRYGILIAQKKYPDLDRLWLRSSLISLAVIGIGAGAIWVVVYGLNAFKLAVADRLLSPLPTGLMLLASILLQFEFCLVAYLRAHKREPILVLNVAMSLMTGFLVWLLGSRFGPTGAGVGYLGPMIIGSIWLFAIWRRCRTEWHRI